MSKKSVSFQEKAEQHTFDPRKAVDMSANPATTTAANEEDLVKKHTLESDEEDDGQEYDRLDEDDIEGQEDSTIAYDGNITITPFNMKEEMQSGHFDATGTYIFDKEDGIKDSWMDNIDWVKVERNTNAKNDVEDDDDNEFSSDSEPEKLDEVAIWKDMLVYLKPGESVGKALRRLGNTGKKMTSAQRLKAKKQGIKPTEEEMKNKEEFQKLTASADSLLQSGQMDVYEETYESLQYKISQAEKTKKRVLPTEDDDAGLDMFGEQFDESTKSKDTVSAEPESKKHKTDSTPEPGANNDNQVMWEFKWKNEAAEPIQGPFNSEQMQQKVDQDQFPSGVYVRKVGSGSDFYSSKRIDFELYI